MVANPFPTKTDSETAQQGRAKGQQHQNNPVLAALTLWQLTLHQKHCRLSGMS